MVAVNDGTIKRIGHNSKLGNYIVLQDTYGNRFTYAQLGRVSKVYPVPKQHKLSASDFKLVTPKKDKAPTQPATRGNGRRPRGHSKASEGPRNTEDAAPAALRAAAAPAQRGPRRHHGPARPAPVQEVPGL